MSSSVTKLSTVSLIAPFLLASLAGFSACSSTPKRASTSAGDSSRPVTTTTGTPPAAPSATPRDGSVTPLVGSLQVHRFELDNGLRLLVVEDHSSPTFAYQTWFRVGSRDEATGYTGLAHFFEHMMFKGTKSHPEGELDRIMRESGAVGFNAFTTHDYTAYVQELPIERLPLVAELEADRMVNLVINDPSFKTERDVVHSERRMRKENSPDGAMMDALYSTVYAQSSYHWPVIGYAEDLERATAHDAEAFYRAYYNPNHATVVVVGDVHANAVRALIQKQYGKIAANEAPARTQAPEPPQTSPRRVNMPLNVEVDKLRVAFRTPSMRQADTAALRVLETILMGGNSARLQRALVDTGIATGVGGGNVEEKDASIFMIATTLQKGKRATQAETAILREIARLKSETLSDRELERAKNRIDFGFYAGLDSNGEVANFLGHSESQFEDFGLALEVQRQTRAVTAADVQRVAKLYLDPNLRTVVTGVPK